MLICGTGVTGNWAKRCSAVILILAVALSCASDDSDVDLESMTAGELNELMHIEGSSKIEAPLPEGFDRGEEPQVTKILLPENVAFDTLFQVEVEFVTGNASLSKLLVQITGADSYFELTFSAVPNTIGTASFPCFIASPNNALTSQFGISVQLGGDSGPHGIAKTVDLPLTVEEEPPTCGDDNGGCDSNATCDVVDNAIVCTCNDGWAGSGLACAEVPEGMVYVAEGVFWRGCNTNIDTQCNGDEKPYKPVSLDGFFIDTFEVTAAQYAACVEAEGCTYNGSTDSAFRTYRNERDTHPINYVNWAEAKAYCEWKGHRLPTESEWEKAARGTEGHMFSWGNDEANCDRAVMATCVDDAQPVGSLDAGKSTYGAMDMTGNVWEWVQDWYNPNYYSDSPMTNPAGPEVGTKRVLRGGAFVSDPLNLRTSKRNSFAPETRYHYFGFRCAD